MMLFKDMFQHACHNYNCHSSTINIRGKDGV